MVYGRTTGKIFPVVRKFFSSWMEGLGMSEGRTWNVGRKDSECRKEGLGMPEGFDKAIYFIELPEPSEVKLEK